MKEQYRRDTLCCYWSASPQERAVCSGQFTVYAFGDEPVTEAVVLLLSSPGESVSIALEHLTPVGRFPGLYAEVEAGERESWSRGYEDGMNKVKSDEGIMW